MSQPYFNPGTREAKALSRAALIVAIVALVAVIVLAVFVLVEGFGGTKGEFLFAAVPWQLARYRPRR